MQRLIILSLTICLLASACSVIRKRDLDSVRIEIIEDEVSYVGGDTLLLHIKLTNQSQYDAVISDHGRSFRLDTPPDDRFLGWTGDWFVGIEERECSDGCLFTLRAGASRAVTTQFVPLHSTAGHPELTLVAVYRVTVKLDGTATAYTAISDDTLKVTIEREQD